MPEAKVWEKDLPDAVSCVCLSSDGTLLVASSGSTIFLFDASGVLLWKADMGSKILRMKLSLGGEYIIASSENSQLHFVDRSGKLLWRRQLSGISNGLSLSKDASFIVIGSDNNNAYFVNRAGQPTWSFKAERPVKCVAVSHFGKYIAAGGVDGNIYVLNMSGQLIWKYKTGGEVSGIAISSEGDYVLAASTDRKLYFFESGGRLIWQPTLEGIPSAVAVSSNGAVAVAAAGNEGYALSKDGALIRKWDCGMPMRDAGVSENGEYFVFSSADKHVYYFQKNGDLLWKASLSADAEHVALSSSGETIVVSSSDKKVHLLDHTRYYDSFIGLAAKAIAEVKEQGFKPAEAERLLELAMSNFERRNFKLAIDNAKAAEAAARKEKELAKPEISVLIATPEGFAMDSWTQVKAIIMNTGSAHASDVRLEFFGQVLAQGKTGMPFIEVNEAATVALAFRPKVAGTLPMKMRISFWSFEGKEFASEVQFQMQSAEPGKKVAFAKAQTLVKFGDVQRVIAKISQKEVKEEAIAKCPKCNKAVDREWLACPFCLTKLKAWKSA